MKIDVKNSQRLSNANLNTNELKRTKLKEASENFEAIFLNFMLKSMMKTSSDRENSIFGGDNFGGDVLDSIFYLELSKHIAKNGKFGIAELIYKQLVEKDSENLKIEGSPKIENAEINRKEKFIELQKNSRKSFFINKYGESLIERINRFDGLIRKASEEFNVPEELIKAVIAVESSGNALAFSPKGAKGLMQLMDSTAEFVGVKNIWNPAENIYGGVKYLRHLLDRFNGDIKLALAGYNAGPENVEKYGGIPPFPETIEYLGKVMKYIKLFEKSKISNADAER
ncbi:transglycosylase SLT domain-containing protein [Candidatus Kryptobacter tengchongensis]|uniref:Rod binding protein n=1 Tax=Kryptobacter tengchongensis TaxID=1643429 RepID=A0A916PHX5_KRYT1|nr:transglycosylase SLT domain-containing protein [Candidatus Kryptobacter tengchongensis]CUS97189.1 Rod binding protein [Candidatus Kryptobacter tengchongensis]